MTATTILCFGDSNTWGFIPGSDCERYAPDVRWPGVMAADLGPGYRVVGERREFQRIDLRSYLAPGQMGERSLLDLDYRDSFRPP